METKGVQIMATDLTQAELEALANELLKEVQTWFREIGAKHPEVEPQLLGKVSAIAISNFLFVNMLDGIYTQCEEKAKKWGD
jgi:hypothetical protein